jgi:protease-4
MNDLSRAPRDDVEVVDWPRSVKRAVFIPMIAGVLSLLSPTLWAQDVTAPHEVVRRNRGLGGREPGFVGTDNATATLLNPADLTLMRGWSFVFEANKSAIAPIAYRWGSGAALSLGRSFSLFGSRKMALAASASRVGFGPARLGAESSFGEMSTRENDAYTASMLRISGGLACDVVPARLSLGFNLGIMRASFASRVHDKWLIRPAPMFGFGASWRATPWLAFGTSIDGVRKLPRHTQTGQQSQFFLPEWRTGLQVSAALSPETRIVGQLGTSVDLFVNLPDEICLKRSCRMNNTESGASVERTRSMRVAEWLHPQASVRVDSPLFGGTSWWVGANLTTIANKCELICARSGSVEACAACRADFKEMAIATHPFPVLSTGVSIALSRRVHGQIGSSLAMARDLKENGKVGMDSPGLGGRVVYEENPSAQFSRTLQWVYHLRLEDYAGGPRRRALIDSLAGALGRQASAIVVHVGHEVGQLADVEDLRWALARWKEKRRASPRSDGAPSLFVYLNGMSLESLYFASVADQILLHPAQPLDLVGQVSTFVNFGALLDKQGVHPQIRTAGEAGGLVERWQAIAPSPAYVESFSRLQNDRFNFLVSDIAHARSLPPEQVVAWIEEAPREPRRALRLGMVESLVWPEQLESHINRIHGSEMQPIDEASLLPASIQDTGSGPELAVVHVSGELIDSAHPHTLAQLARGTTSVSILVPLLEELGRSWWTRAVIIRLDSPGGSAWAARTLGHAIEELARTKIVIVSIGAQATGAAYYAALGADAILADASSVVGGVGAFRWGFSLRDWLAKQGIGLAIFGGSMAHESESWCVEHERRSQGPSTLVESFEGEYRQRVATLRNSQKVRSALERGESTLLLGSRAAADGWVDALGGISQAQTLALRLAGKRFFATRRDYSPQPEPQPWVGLVNQFLGKDSSPEDLARLSDLVLVLKRLPLALALCGNDSNAVYSLYERYFARDD